MTDGAWTPANSDGFLRILIVCQNDLASASTKQAVAFAEGLAAKGHSVLLSLAGDPASVAREGLREGERLRVSFRREYAFLVAPKSLKEAHRFMPHILHVFNPRHYTVSVARQLHRATKAAVVVHWEDDELGIRQGVVRRNPVRKVGRLARRVLCYPLPRQGVFVTRTSLRWVQRHASICDALTPSLASSVEAEAGVACVPVLPACMTPDGDAGQADPMARQQATILKAAKIAYTGSVHTESIDDFRLAIRAVSSVARRGYDVAFVHAGHLLPRYDVAAIAREEGLTADRVVSLGYIPFGQVQSVLREASVLVQPGRPNRFNRLRLPSKVQAYLESGTPTVMFSVGLGELLDDEEEVVKLHKFSAHELADRIAALLDNPERARRIGEGGQQAARRLFDRDRNVEALLGCYMAALDSRSAISR